MTLIQGYLFRQLALPVSGVCAALVGIGVLSQSLEQLEFVVERGQSLWLMLKLTLLAIPQLLGVILPIGLFIGCLITLTRLQREQELTAVQAAGLTRLALVRPAFKLALIVAGLGLLLNVVIQPWSQTTARQQAFAVRSELAALLVEEGRFVQGPDGLTVYVQEIEQNGLLRNLFIYIDSGGTSQTWSAAEARFGRVEGQPVLTLVNGSSQRYSDAGVLNLLAFDTYVFPLGSFAETIEQPRYKPSDLGLSDLFMPREGLVPHVGTSQELMGEGHARLSSPLYALAAVALALAAIVGGPFSRTGYGLRVAKAAGVFLGVRILGYGVVAAAAWNPWLNLLQYLFPLGVTALALVVLFQSPARRRPARGFPAWLMPLRGGSS